MACLKDRPGLNKSSEKTSWLRRYRAHVAKKPSCDCHKFSPKEYWYETNRNIIMTLSGELGLHADFVCEFLYRLTMQNFGKVLNPRGHVWNACRVPLCNFATCDYYMGIFDSEGNVRDPYDPRSLPHLLKVMQTVLKQDKETGSTANMSLYGTEEPPGSKDFGPKATRYNLQTATMAGIGPHSVARENGLRRRFQLHEKYRLDGHKDNHLPLWDASNRTNKNKDKNFANAFGSDIPGNNAKNAAEFPDTCETDDSHIGGNNPYEASISSVRKYNSPDSHRASKNQKIWHRANYVNHAQNLQVSSNHAHNHLRDLMRGVYQDLNLVNSFDDFVNAVKNLNLVQANRSDLDKNRELAESISNHYNKRAKGHFYYGAQIPILFHKPYDRQDSSTWIRRHPHLLRVNDLGNVIEAGTIHRYKRQTIANIMEEARRTASVYSIYKIRESYNTRDLQRRNT